MTKLQHPASLNAFQQYRQVRQILRRTSRASNPAWYEEATALPLQLHIRIDGASVTSHIFESGADRWSAGPPVESALLKDPEAAAAFARDLITTARGMRARAIGVILHIADEFAISELQPQSNDPAALDELRQTVIDDPAAVLADTSAPVHESSWRLVPYPARDSEAVASAATVSRQYDPFLDALRKTGEQQNFPVITRALSAPLVALAALGTLTEPTADTPFLGILQYAGFTVVGFFDARGELKQLRTMHHRGRKRFANFRHALLTTNAALEIIDPDIFILPLCDEADDMLEPDLRISMPDSRIERIGPPGGADDAAPLPAWCVEPGFAANPAARPCRIPSRTFELLIGQRWAFQDFLPVPPEVAALVPSRAEVRLFRIARLTRAALFLAALGGIGWLAYSYARASMRPEWASNPDQVNMEQAHLNQLNQQRTRAEHWHNLLADRSKAWITMEHLVRMFPEDSGVKVNTFQYSAQPEADRRQANTGFIREWRISGLARGPGERLLSQLNTSEGIASHFADFARLTGNEAYRTDEATRHLSVRLSTQENRRFSPPTAQQIATMAESAYPFTFTLTITQRFAADDPLAIRNAAAP